MEIKVGDEFIGNFTKKKKTILFITKEHILIHTPNKDRPSVARISDFLKENTPYREPKVLEGKVPIWKNHNGDIYYGSLVSHKDFFVGWAHFKYVEGGPKDQ